MNQPVTDELISAYLDGELTPAEVVEMERQLEESAELREKLEEFSQLSVAMQSLTAVEAPADFRSSILSQLNDKPLVKPEPPPKYSFAWWRPIVAVCLLIGLGSILLNRNKDELSDTVAQNDVPESLPLPEVLPPTEGEGDDHTVENDELVKSVLELAEESDTMELPAGSMHAPIAPSSEEPSQRMATPARLEIEEELAQAALAAIVVPEDIPVTDQLIKEKLLTLQRLPEYGEVISILDEGQLPPVVVEFSVVDVMDSMGKLNVLLRQSNSVRSLMKDKGDITPDDQKSTSPKFTAVILELDNEVEMIAFLSQLPSLGAKIYLPVELQIEKRMLADTTLSIPPPPLPERISGYEIPRPFELSKVQKIPEHKIQGAALKMDTPEEKQSASPRPKATSPADTSQATSKPLRTLIILQGTMNHEAMDHEDELPEDE